jgi:hypothetical protein
MVATRSKLSPWLTDEGTTRKPRPMQTWPPQPCPHLPSPVTGLDHNHLGRHGENRDIAFYTACLEYGQALWVKGFAARAMLCLDRAMGANLRGDEEELTRYPMPYAAMGWFMSHSSLSALCRPHE